jgi:hypothetical protein
MPIKLAACGDDGFLDQTARDAAPAAFCPATPVVFLADIISAEPTHKLAKAHRVEYPVRSFFTPSLRS